MDVNPQKNGVNYTYYEDFKATTTDQIGKTGKEMKKGILEGFSIADAAGKDAFAYEFEAYMKISETDMYIFDLTSDDGAVLYIDGTKVADNDGSHSSTTAKGNIVLEKGFHKISLRYFDDCDGERLELLMTGSGFHKKLLPAEILYTTGN